MSELPEVYVISLDRATRRREQFRAECDRIGLPYHIFRGVDGREQEVALRELADEKSWNLNMGAPLSAGHMGCYASHVQLWEQIGQGEDDIVLICEDDVTFHDDFMEALGAALEVSGDWDICRFAKIRAKGPVKVRQIGSYTLNAYWGPFTGNACYLIKRETAQKLAASFWPMSRAHDHELNRFFHYDIRLMGLEPFAASPRDEDESFITGRAMSDAKKFPKWKRLPYYGQKLANYVRRLIWLKRRGYL